MSLDDAYNQWGICCNFHEVSFLHYLHSYRDQSRMSPTFSGVMIDFCSQYWTRQLEISDDKLPLEEK